MSENENLLSPKDAEIVRLRAEGKSLTEIGKQVLPEAKWPAQSVYKHLQKPAVRARLVELMEKHFSDEYLLAELKKLVKAKKIVSLKVEGRKVKIGKKVPDHDVRLRSLENVFKLKGSYAPAQLEVRSALDAQQRVIALLQRISSSCEHCRALIQGELAEPSTVEVEEVTEEE